MKKQPPSQAELAHLACLLDKGGKLPSKDLVSRAFEIWREAGVLLAQEERKPPMIENEAAECFFDKTFFIPKSFSEIANRGWLPSDRTKSRKITEIKRVGQIFAEYKKHLVVKFRDKHRSPQECEATAADLTEVADALKSKKATHQLIEKVKAYLEQKRDETQQIRAEGKSPPRSSVPECSHPNKVMEPVAILTEKDNAKGRTAPKR